MKTQILQLRSEGKTYAEIALILGCSKGTVCYYCGNNQVEKCRNRQRKRRTKQHPFFKKIENFCSNVKQGIKTNQLHKYKKLIQLKIECFSRIGDKRQMYQKPIFTVDNVINKFGETPKCALTGEVIDIYEPRTYAFDHKIPVSRGGNNTIDNLQILTKKANQAKHSLTDDEFIELCKKVLIHQGYNITKQ